MWGMSGSRRVYGGSTELGLDKVSIRSRQGLVKVSIRVLDFGLLCGVAAGIAVLFYRDCQEPEGGKNAVIKGTKKRPKGRLSL